MKKIKFKSTKGITLIALVITIVLLILAGVSIATLTGENGILTQAEDAKKETTRAEAREMIQLETAASFDNKGKYNVDTAIENLKNNAKIPAEDITKNNDGTINVKLKGYEFKADENGKVTDYINIANYVKVGHYVDYEPTKTDVNKTQAVESSKLTYTSPVGTIPTDSTGIITHGNGNSEQTFTAKANDGTETGVKWRVLSVSDNKVELISEKLVLKDDISKNNGNFVLEGGIGYLYAEQELNEVCKIYGYGYGADTSIETTYTVGGPEDTPVIGKIEGTGARSITIEDLNKLAGIYEDKADEKMKYSDGTVINSSYGTTINLTKAIYYPTLSSSNTTYPGRSESTKPGFKYDYYLWNNQKITDNYTRDMIFNGNYWLASRCVRARSSNAGFGVRNVGSGSADAYDLCSGNSSALYQYAGSFCAVRPVVTLKSDVIDINTDYDTEGEWKLK